MARFALPPRTLQALFPSSSPQTHAPDMLLDEVALVHPFPSQALELEEAALSSDTSTNVVAPILALPDVPAGVFDEIIFGDVLHTGAAGVRPILSLFIVDPTGAATLLGLWQWDSAILVSVPLFSSGSFATTALDAMSPPRPLICPPGWNLQLQGTTQAVAYQIRLARLALRRPLADVPLFR